MIPIIHPGEFTHFLIPKKNAQLVFAGGGVEVERSATHEGSGVAAVAPLQAGRTYAFEVVASANEPAVLGVKSKNGAFVLRGPELSWLPARALLCFTATVDGPHELRVHFAGRASGEARIRVDSLALNELAWERRDDGRASLPLASAPLTGRIAYRLRCATAADLPPHLALEATDPGSPDAFRSVAIERDRPAASGLAVEAQGCELRLVAGQVPGALDMTLEAAPTYPVVAFGDADEDDAPGGGELPDATVVATADPLRLARVVAQLRPGVARIFVSCPPDAILGLPSVRARLRNVAVLADDARPLHAVVARAAARQGTHLVCPADLDYPDDFAAQLCELVGRWRGQALVGMAGWPQWPAGSGGLLAAEAGSGATVLAALAAGPLAFAGPLARVLSPGPFADEEAAAALSDALLAAGVPIVTPARPRRWLRQG